MSGAIQVMTKLAALADIFKAAKTLEYHGLLGGRNAESVVREYIAANPEINEARNKKAQT